jgi:hypothetical protein
MSTLEMRKFDDNGDIWSWQVKMQYVLISNGHGKCVCRRVRGRLQMGLMDPRVAVHGVGIEARGVEGREEGERG